MGFRDYDPGLNRFLTRDMYNGALEDMRLTLDPWNMNRYSFAGGNPVSFVELDGHRYIVADGVYAHSITGKIVEDRSSSTASGSGGDSSGYGLRDFGKVVGGVFVGLWEGLSETVTGIYQSKAVVLVRVVLYWLWLARVLTPVQRL